MHSTYTIESLQQSVAVANAKPDRKYFSLTAKQGEQLLTDIRAHNAQLVAALEWCAMALNNAPDNLGGINRVNVLSQARAALRAANQ